MKLTANAKRVLSALLVFVLVLSLIPAHVFAAGETFDPGKAIDAAAFFSDLHTQKNDSNYASAGKLLTNVLTSMKNGTGMTYSSVTSCGDAFGVNSDYDNTKFDGKTEQLNTYITGVMGSNVDINYVWSDHDRYGQINGKYLDCESGLVYGDATTNYYIYELSQADTSTDLRYPTQNTTIDKNKDVTPAINAFKEAVAAMDKTKPLIIAAHQPLLDRRNDNGHAYKWAQAINEVAETMDVVYFYGHNHARDVEGDYYYAKGSTMSICCDSSGNAKDMKLNFHHICVGYMAPVSENNYTRKGAAMSVVIYENAIRYTIYGADGVYNDKSHSEYNLNILVEREHEDPTAQPETPETPDVPVTPTDPETPTEPETPSVPENEWIALPAGNTYVLDTDGIDSGAMYLIVASSYAKALSAATSNNNAVSITIDGNNATADAAYGWIFTASGSGYTIQNNGTYLGRSSSKLAAGSSSTTWTVSNSGSGQYTITQSGSSSSWWGSSSKYYVRWSNSSGYFQASSSNSNPVRLYKYAGSGSSLGVNYIRLAGTTVQEYTVADNATVDTILSNLVIETSANGVNADSATVAVTADMLTWNTSFDSKTAGTYTATVTCEGKVLGTITVTVTGAHQYETITVNPTCTTDGSITTICTGCGEQTVEVLEATGHSYSCAVTAPTCTENGSLVYTCSACAHSYTETVAAVGHTIQTVTVKATCVSDGSVTSTCTACGLQSVEVLKATGHSYTFKVTAPTCTEEGYTTYTCVCGDTYIGNTVAATGHSYNAVTTEPTCVNEGKTVYTCHCGGSYTVTIPATGEHIYTAVVTAPSCTEDGYTTHTCTTCGDSYTTDVVAAKGHPYTAVVTAPTCTESGRTTHTCTACGDSYETDLIAALGHDHTAVVTAPTCTEEGYTTYTCATCGHSYTADRVAALGHDYTAVVTAPTCTEEGYTTYTCATCGHSYTGNTVAVTGHSYTTQEVDGYLVYTCHCGHSYSEKLEQDLSYVKTSSLSNGNQVITFVSGSKYYALSHQNNKVSAVRVTVSGNEITSEVTDDLIWNYSGNVLSYEDNGTVYYLYSQAGSWFSTPTLTISTTQSTTVSLSGGKLKLGSYYLRYSSSKVSLNRSGTTVGLFKETEN